MAPVTQIVLFEPKADASIQQIQTISNEALAFKSECLHPETQQPYIKSITGGKGNIIDVFAGSQGNNTLIFIVEFENEEDRLFFVEKDAAHLGFIQRSAPHVAKAQVASFSPGAF